MNAHNGGESQDSCSMVVIGALDFFPHLRPSGAWRRKRAEAAVRHPRKTIDMRTQILGECNENYGPLLDTAYYTIL